MRIRKRNFKKIKDGHNFWPSFTDMISTIALVLFFLMLLAYIQNIITGKNFEYAKKQLMDTQKKLEESNAEISHAEKKLRLLKDEIKEVMAEVEEGEIALKISQEQIEEQKKIIAQSNKELGNLRTKLQGIAVLRLDVLKKVKGSIESELGKKNEAGEELVSIGDNGNIIINEGLVFSYNSYQLKPEGKKLLNKLADAFERILEDKQIRENIDAINIQGHTDDAGSSAYNRDLSAKRATTVVNYLMASNKKIEEKYGKYFVASAYSEFRPITKGKTDADKAKNRRIEISVILKDAHVQEVINNYLKESMEVFEE